MRSIRLIKIDSAITWGIKVLYLADSLDTEKKIISKLKYNKHIHVHDLIKLNQQRKGGKKEERNYLIIPSKPIESKCL